ncbi:hypothetical protein [Nocardioides sp.]|uniref:hypothetical protein n=1 Tax=Nocardioides sp. TaxID=35761 RepID=UPI003514A1C1
MDETDEVTRAVRGLAGAVTPAPEAALLVHRGVRRRRRRRLAVAAAAGATATAMSVGGVVTLGPGDAGPADGDRRVAVASDPEPSTPTGRPAPACPEAVAAPPTRAVPDLEDQRRAVVRLRSLSSVQVVRAVPTPLGVVALVADDGGDPDLTLPPDVVGVLRAAGARWAYEWDPSGPAVGLDAAAQVRQVLAWQLDPVVADLRRATAGLPGAAGLAVFPEAGTVLLQWRAPVPAQVAALARDEPGEVQVVVEGVRYSERDVREAGQRLWDDAGLADSPIDLVSTSGCGDGSGLRVGIATAVRDVDGWEERLAEVAGMPVTLVVEGPIDELLPAG